MTRTPPRPRHRYKDLGLQQLRTFCTVCERGGYAPAARVLSLTPPAVWEQSKGLESFLEIKLLERQGNEVRPTAEGIRLLELVRPILAQLDSVKEMLHQERGSLPVQMTIVAASHLLMKSVSQAAREFCRSRPNILLNISVGAVEKPASRTANGKPDLSFAYAAESAPAADGVGCEHLGNRDFLLIAPREHPLAGTKQFRLRDVAAAPFVLEAAGSFAREKVDDVLTRKGLDHRVKIVAESGGDEGVLSLVAAGMGVGIVVGDADDVVERGLSARSLRRWFGMARVVARWTGPPELPQFHREFVSAVCSSLQQKKEA